VSRRSIRPAAEVPATASKRSQTYTGRGVAGPAEQVPQSEDHETPGTSREFRANIRATVQAEGPQRHDSGKKIDLLVICPWRIERMGRSDFQPFTTPGMKRFIRRQRAREEVLWCRRCRTPLVESRWGFCTQGKRWTQATAQPKLGISEHVAVGGCTSGHGTPRRDARVVANSQLRVQHPWDVRGHEAVFGRRFAAFA